MDFDPADKIDEIIDSVNALSDIIDEVRNDPPPGLNLAALDTLCSALALAKTAVADLEEQRETGTPPQS